MATPSTKRRSDSSGQNEGNQPLMKWTRNRTIIAAAGAAVAAASAALFAFGRRRTESGERDAPAHSTGKIEPSHGATRSAGPEAMRDPPSDWSQVDQASDESFPASDPPPVGSRVD